MSYILGLLFNYHRYKRDVVIRVYADDRLVDELNLSDDIKLKTVPFGIAPVDRRAIGPRDHPSIKILPEKLFLFEIDEKYLCNSIRIEVKNNDNNYNNGFMTKFSYVKFHQLFLVPDWLLQSDMWNRLERFRGNNLCNFSQQSDGTWKKRYELYPRNLMSDEFTFTSDSAESEPWTKFYNFKQGGNYTVDIPLTRKHRLVHLGQPTPGTLENGKRQPALGKMHLNENIERILWAYKVLNTSK